MALRPDILALVLGSVLVAVAVGGAALGNVANPLTAALFLTGGACFVVGAVRMLRRASADDPV